MSDDEFNDKDGQTEHQHFHGTINGGVAGRDIINAASMMLWDYESSDLDRELSRCRSKLWQMRRDIFLSVPFFWFVAGALGSMYLMLSGSWFKVAGQPWMIAWLIGAMMIPSLWLTAIRHRKGKMIALYRNRIDIIDTILQDRA